VHNPAWWAKVAFILIAGLNILAFELSPRAKALVQEVGPGDNTPAASQARRRHLALFLVRRALLRSHAAPSSALPFRACRPIKIEG
jgi:hypothetical protein